jgi:hypothetical protein
VAHRLWPNLDDEPDTPELAPIEDTMTRPSADIASIADDSGEEDDLSKPCSACGAKPGGPCLDLDDDGNPTGGSTRGGFHAARIFGPGPIVIRHTGFTDADGGGIFEVVGDEMVGDDSADRGVDQ